MLKTPIQTFFFTCFTVKIGYLRSAWARHWTETFSRWCCAEAPSILPPLLLAPLWAGAGTAAREQTATVGWKGELTLGQKTPRRFQASVLCTAVGKSSRAVKRRHWRSSWCCEKGQVAVGGEGEMASLETLFDLNLDYCPVTPLQVVSCMQPAPSTFFKSPICI